MSYSKCTNKNIVRCTQHSMYFGLAGSHLHTGFSKNMGFVAPACPRHPHAAATVCGGADNGDAPAVATSFEPYPTS